MADLKALKKEKRIKILITGIVQGVGFRPTVYKYALECNLTGFILNSIQGVTIELQGRDEEISHFIYRLKSKPPKASIIDSFEAEEIKIENFENCFQILFSEKANGNKSAGISPDLATCPQCREDIFRKEDLRNSYPFTNCTNCGPRFTIIKDRPYDRKYTSMAEFRMCPNCQKEYSNPLDRRFHAQPNACPLCGPRIKLLLNTKDSLLEEHWLSNSVDFIKNGSVAAIKGLGGFHFACDPFHQRALIHLRKVKNRPFKSFALMMQSVEEIRKYCHISRFEIDSLSSNAAPIVLLKKKNNLLNHISPDNNYLGIMLPYTPLHHLLMKEIPILVMTSANKSDEPLAICDSEVSRFMDSGIVDFIITHDRDIIHRCDDSIVQFHDDSLQFLRRSRGFVPHPVIIDSKESNPSLSLGANLKNTFALKQGRKVYLSQHIGDLTDYRNLEYQSAEIDEFSHLLDIQAEEIRCDAHPGYENYSKQGKKIFHHHAHMLSVMAEKNLSGPDIIGVICDGTGYGTDGSIWGFEFLKNNADDQGFTRLGNLDYFQLPGGEKAISEIDRIAISLTERAGSLPFSWDKETSIRSLINSGINCPRTSSLGRLFDGIAALTGLASFAEYEAKGAILLQREAELITEPPEKGYTVKTSNTGEMIIIDYHVLISEILTDMEDRISIPAIAWKFHKWVADSIIVVLGKFDSSRVVLSGGCFQNLLLMKLVKENLINQNYEFYYNEKVPPNDGGIALGQAFI